MARALACPACSTRHAIDGVEPGATFSCTGCGRTLRAPGTPAAPTTTPATPAAAGTDPAPTRSERRRAATASGPATGFPTAVRVGAWIVSVILGGVIALFVARTIGLLSTDNLIDLITGSGSGRYLRMALLLPIWALVTTGLVTLVLDGGWHLLHRTAAPTKPRPTRRAPADAAATPADAVPAAARPTTGVPDRGEPQRPRRIPPRDTGA